MNSISRRTLLRCAQSLCALTLTAVTACSPLSDTASNPNTINILTYAGLFQDSYRQAVVDPFLEANPGYEVNLLSASGSSEMLANLRADGSSGQFDVVIMDTSVADTAIAEGRFAKLSADGIPNLDNVIDRAVNASGYGPALTFDSIVLMYNPVELGFTPDSWNSLWDDRATQIALPSPPSLMAIGWIAIMADVMGVDYKQDVGTVLDRMAELRPRVSTFDPSPEQYTLVQSGAASISIGWNARARSYASESGGALAVANTEGSIFQTNTINITESSSNAEAAQLFTNYALDAQTQSRFSQLMPYAPSVEGVTLPPEVESVILRADSPDAIPFDWPWLTAQVRDQWGADWRSEVVGG
ncbi:hypothetical protein BTO20_00405 [Mycobacterium dioxanotrophicus]|uniref:ABC transporter substrate-binding protein n=1 Tax=Mycobacterium dioxanotrophicus TaxID=482462 RepID=A0A1Y0BWK5_9MYCO|nr:extracellular solute-binding protein [Mycobacterium dioxanotrophicus]ART67285.1 hypothetical protein BTO20_00405 [Mycobacterium dioxanotrophicus]